MYKNRWDDKATCSSCRHNATGFMKKFAAIMEKIGLKDEEVAFQLKNNRKSSKRHFSNEKSIENRWKSMKINVLLTRCQILDFSRTSSSLRSIFSVMAANFYLNPVAFKRYGLVLSSLPFL